ELGVVEQRPMQEGRNMTMMMAPSKAVLSGRLESGDGAESPSAETPGGEAATPAAPSNGQPSGEAASAA
ncbi:MAG TPA: hypothetical protein VF927_11225, partial [Solirubrobacteraceae bacterium]